MKFENVSPFGEIEVPALGADAVWPHGEEREVPEDLAPLLAGQAEHYEPADEEAAAVALAAVVEWAAVTEATLLDDAQRLAWVAEPEDVGDRAVRAIAVTEGAQQAADDAGTEVDPDLEQRLQAAVADQAVVVEVSPTEVEEKSAAQIVEDLKTASAEAVAEILALENARARARVSIIRAAEARAAEFAGPPVIPADDPPADPPTDPDKTDQGSDAAGEGGA